MMPEVRDSIILTDNDDYIDIINKKIIENFGAIYDAVTEIELGNNDTYKKVKLLVAKQECYKMLREAYLNNDIKSIGVKLRG